MRPRRKEVDRNSRSYCEFYHPHPRDDLKTCYDEKVKKKKQKGFLPSGLAIGHGGSEVLLT